MTIPIPVSVPMPIPVPIYQHQYQRSFGFYYMASRIGGGGLGGWGVGTQWIIGFGVGLMDHWLFIILWQIPLLEEGG